MNWETLPTFTCLWMSFLTAVQYYKKAHASTLIMSVGYFFVLFIAGVLTSYGPALRFVAAGILLTLILWQSPTQNNLSLLPQGKKRSALMKLPILVALIAWSLRSHPRYYSVGELVFAVLMFMSLWKNKEREAVRVRLFIKTTILGTLYLVLKIALKDYAIFQFVALLLKMGALYYLYCFVSSYAAQSYLRQYSQESSS